MHTVSTIDVWAARNLLKDTAVVTPVHYSRYLSELVGQPVWLKLENLQRAGSFKVRGAYNRMARLTPEEQARGVVAASAGNHAQGVALAAQKLGINALIYMPYDAPLPKVEATRAYGAEVRLVGRSVDESLALAQAEAEESGRVLIHPFDHLDIVAGQGTIALEILEQVPDVGTIVVPVGGGGLVAGIATVLGELAPNVSLIGVQAENAAAYPDSLAARKPLRKKLGRTMADGIAIGIPGEVPLEILSRLDVPVRTVSEGDLARALLALVERAKLVVEPAGAAGVAAVMADPTGLTNRNGEPGPVVVVLSGGNVDPLLMMRVIRRGMVEASRFLQLRVRLDDRPGSLAKLIGVAADSGANVVDVHHSRIEAQLGPFEAIVHLELEAKGPEHRDAISEAIEEAGFRIESLPENYVPRSLDGP